MSWKTICWEVILLGFLFSCTGSDKEPEDRKLQIDYDYLKSNFQQPDKAYGVNCWWWWLNGNVTKDAITKDLEAMKSRNFQGAMIFDAGGHNQRGNKDIPAGPLFGSEEWTDLFVFALDEAKRLDWKSVSISKVGGTWVDHVSLRSMQPSNSLIPNKR